MAVTNQRWLHGFDTTKRKLIAESSEVLRPVIKRSLSEVDKMDEQEFRDEILVIQRPA